MLRHALPLALALFLLPACDSTAEFVIGGTYSGVTEVVGSTTTTATFEIPETASGRQFSFEVTVAESGPGGTNETRSVGGGTYEHPAILLTVEDESVGGLVADDGASFQLEIGPGEFVTFTRE